MALDIPLPTASPQDDPEQYVPLLLSAIEGFLLARDVWAAADYLDAYNYMQELMEYINTMMRGAAVRIGSIVMCPNDTIPDKWLLCDGSNVLRTDYPELSALFPIGGSWGGSASEISLPDFTGRSPVMPTLGVVDSPGKITGAASHTLTTPELPSHNHGVTDPGHNHDQQVGASPAYIVSGSTGRFGYSASGTSSLTRVHTDDKTTGISTTNTGGAGSHNNIHPVLGINFIIYAGR